VRQLDVKMVQRMFSTDLFLKHFRLGFVKLSNKMSAGSPGCGHERWF
jgi:hypothetical protein